MAEKPRKDYVLNGRQFYMTELVIGQVDLINEVELEASKAGFSPYDMSDSEAYGAYLAKYGTRLLSIGLIPAEQTQSER